MMTITNGKTSVPLSMKGSKDNKEVYDALHQKSDISKNSSGDSSPAPALASTSSDHPTVAAVPNPTEDAVNSKAKNDMAAPATSTGTNTEAFVPSFPAEYHTKNEKKTFPEIMMDILTCEDDPEVSAAITWLPCGTAFQILDSQILAEKVVPRFFQTAQSTKFASFTRKLNRWGFKQVGGKRGLARNSPRGESGTFHHRLFLRDQPKLCLGMECQKSSSAKHLRMMQGNPYALGTMPSNYGSLGASLLANPLGMATPAPSLMELEHQLNVLKATAAAVSSPSLYSMYPHLGQLPGMYLESSPMAQPERRDIANSMPSLPAAAEGIASASALNSRLYSKFDTRGPLVDANITPSSPPASAGAPTPPVHESNGPIDEVLQRHQDLQDRARKILLDSMSH